MKKKGMALIAVIVMIVLFTSLILAVVLSATMSIRRANYYKDKLIALEIAETGLQKILYNMNYYGYQENNTGTTWTRASWIGANFKSSSFSLPQWYSDLITSKGLTENDLTKYETEISLPEYGGKGKYTLYFIDANSQTTSETDLDLIVAKGSYRGRTATISFLLRGAGEIKSDGVNYYYGDFKDKNPNRTLGTCGIPEAFNKHVIYANNITLSGTNITVKGNITTTSQKPNPWPSTWKEATWTETNIDFMNYLPRVETEICYFVIPSLPPTSYNERYDNTGKKYNSIYPSGIDVNSIADGVWWNGTDTYYFGTDDGSNPANFTSQSNILVEANAIIPDFAGNVTISHYFHVEGSTTPNINGDLTINKSITTTTTNPDFCFEVKGNLTIASGITINGDLVVKGQPLNLNNINVNGNVKCDQDITINGGTIDKDVLSKSNITINAGTINGCVLCYDISPKTHIITISNNPTINASNSSYDAGIYIYNNSSGSSGTININGSPTITLGEKQKAGIVICVPYGANSININNPFTLKYYNSLNPSQPSNYPFNQFAIVNYGASNSAINTNTNLNLNGAIYSSGNITFNNNTQNIKGLVVAGNTLTIGNNTNISYYPDQYKNNNSDAFKGFVGGRRKYLPVPGSWRIEW